MGKRATVTTPTKRGPKRGPAPKERFLLILRESANVTAASRAAGWHRATAYRQREDDPEFARQWDEALEAAADELEQVAWQRARDGSDTLLIFLLKGHKPERFRERKDVTSGGHPVKAIIGVDVDEL